jgi:hypothetical protein
VGGTAEPMNTKLRHFLFAPLKRLNKDVAAGSTLCIFLNVTLQLTNLRRHSEK